MMRILIIAAASLVLAGCTGGGVSTAGGSGAVTVFAAASLTGTFDALADRFEALHPGTRVVLNYGGSSGLAAQITEGAPADVFAAADEPTMQSVVQTGDASDPIVFTTNTLQIAVPAGNPADVRGLADFADVSLAIALCDPSVPCGAASQRLFDLTGVEAAPDTLEPDVRSVLTKVQLGEADAGLVYVTDVLAAGAAVEGVSVPEARQAVNRYPIAVLRDSPNPAGARAWVDFVLSEEGQRALAGAGFVAP